MLKKYLSLRWILLGTGILAIVGLTAMNVFSLYRLHETTIESDLENKKLQIAEFTDRAHYRFLAPFKGLGMLEMEHTQKQFEQSGEFPGDFLNLLDNAARDSIYNDIYFKTEESKACRNNGCIYQYDPQTRAFRSTSKYPEFVCEGMSMARTRMKVLLDDYRYNNKVIFDTHRSTTIALINLTSGKVFGYLNLPINQEFMVEQYLKQELVHKFGNADSSGVIVWLRDWTKGTTIASSDPSVPFDDDKVQYYQRFPDFLDNWHLKVAFSENPTIAASRASLVKNFVVLGVAFTLLLGALVFIFVTAQKERALAQRQAGFLANVTHELKTPLAVMQAAGENLADGRVDNEERLKSYGRHIHSEALRLKRMIDKLLDVAKADAGQSLIEPRPVQLEELLEDYMETHLSYIHNNGFTLETSIEKPLPPVMIDEDHFETILGNLIENALKYSQNEKYLAVNLYRADDDIRLEIMDHGVGIPKKSRTQIFEKFYRVEDSLTAHTKGHGLGLSIVKNLVELNGGEIRVISEEGEGSQFIIELPVLGESVNTANGTKRPVKENEFQESSQYARQS
ncbi:MAG: HAMP domain-containing sensor histidine kinase [Balneolaceae bacterium]|nr:HAMP domain-containing sensor histidine kinase [Balneolaceae bacterium]